MKYTTAQFKKSLNSVKGFSLIELMVVIAVIAILAVIGVTVYGNVQRGARDSRRKADIDSIAAALETTKANNPNSPTYGALANTSFAATTVPVDSTTEKYAICYSLAAATNAGGQLPTAWGVVAVPTAPTAGCNGGAWQQISTTQPQAGSFSWTACAKLEAGGYYCKSNTQ